MHGAVILSKKPMKKEYIQRELDDFADKRFVAQSEKNATLGAKIKR